MNFRVTAILFGVVIALVVGLLIFALTREDSATADDGLLSAFAASVKADDVDTFELSRTAPDEQRLIFKKQDRKWSLVSPVPARVDGVTIDGLVRELLQAKPVRYEGSTDNMTTLGLSKPTVTCVLKSGDKTATVHVGLTTIGKNQAVTFLTTGDRPDAPVAVRTADLRSLFRDADRDKGGDPHIIGKWLSDFRQRRLLGVDTNNVGGDLESIKLTRGDRKLELTRADDEWQFAAPANYGLADTAGDPLPSADRFTGVRPLLNTLVNLQVNGVEDYTENVTPADYAKYALAADDPTVIRVELKPKSQPAEVLFIGKKVEKDGKPVVPTKVYCRVEGDSAVAAVPTDRLESLINTVADPAAMRNRDLIVENKRDRIDAIDSTFAGGFRLRRVAGPADRRWALYGGPNDPTDTNEQLVTALLGALAKSRVATAVLLTPNDAAFAGAEAKGELKVWFDAVEKGTPQSDGKWPPEPKLKGEPVSFLFGKIEGNEVYVRRSAGGQATDFKVPADVLVAASKPRAAYVDPKLGSFTPAAAESLVLFRNGVRTELKKEASTDPAYRGGKWTFVTPEAEKGKVADGDKVFEVLGVLASLVSPKLHSENASNEELKKLGLDPAAPIVSARAVIPTEKEKEREYHFGNETTDKTGVFMRLVGKPFVFVVERVPFTQIATADLSDKVVFRVDAKKVRKLFLNGWRPAVKDGASQNMVLEWQNGVWVATEPAGSAVEPARVTAILTALEAPRAIAVMPAEGDQPTPPEYGFGDNPLSIVAELEDKTAVSLQIGGEEKNKTGVYARANKKTYLLNPIAIRPILEKSPLIGR